MQAEKKTITVSNQSYVIIVKLIKEPFGIWFDSLTFKLCTIYEGYNRKKVPVCYHMVLGSQGVRQSGSKFTFSCDLKCKPS